MKTFLGDTTRTRVASMGVAIVIAMVMTSLGDAQIVRESGGAADGAEGSGPGKMSSGGAPSGMRMGSGSSGDGSGGMAGSSSGMGQSFPTQDRMPFQVMFRGVVRLTYVIKISDVVAHVSSGAAVVLSESAPVVACRSSLLAMPDEPMFKDAPKGALKHSFYLQDVQAVDPDSDTRFHRVDGPFANMDFPFPTSLTIHPRVSDGRRGGGGFGRGMGSGGMGGGASGGWGGMGGVIGFTSIPGVGSQLLEFTSLSELSEAVNVDKGIAFVTGISNLKGILLGVSLLKSTDYQDRRKSMERYSLVKSVVPQIESDSGDKLGDNEFIVDKQGFFGLIVRRDGESPIVPGNKILESYVQVQKAQFAAAKSGTDPTASMSLASMSAGVNLPNATPDSRNQWLTDAVVTWRTANSSSAEKDEAKAKLEHLLSQQFDAQRAIKKLEIEELKVRLSELEKSEVVRINNKAEIVADRLKKLTESQN